MAPIRSKIGRVVYGAGREEGHSMCFDTLPFIADAYRDDIIIGGGCLRAECATLSYPSDAALPREDRANL